MTDDLSTFWQNNECARTLFYDLLARAERDAYDEDFLALLAAYRQVGGSDVHADIFAAEYLLAQGDAESAVLCGARAYEKRPVNAQLWQLLAVVYQQLGRSMDSLVMQGRSYGLCGAPKLSLHLCADDVTEGLGRLSFAMGKCLNAPIATSRAYVENQELAFRFDVFIGEEIPLTMPEGSARFWSGVYTENAGLSDHSHMLANARHDDWFIGYGHRDFFFDLQKAQEVRGTTNIKVRNGGVIVPLAGTEMDQPLSITTPSGGTQETYLGKWAFSFFRFEEDAVLHASADTPYAVGTPICLGHSPKRRTLVLNIFVDGLSWAIARPYAPTHLPRLMRFFARGTIFDQHFSTSEHTLPAFPAIETGRYPHHTHIFNVRAGCELPLHMTTIAEQMKLCGYYCAAPMACSQGLSHGVLRGYDRLILSSWIQNSVDGVDSVIRHIRAFDEVDQFLFLVINDVHPYDALGFKFDTAVETHLPLSERFFTRKEKVPSVHLANLRIYQEQYLERMRQADRSLGMLFSYLEEHFKEDEYLVNLYSDHGVSVFYRTPDGKGDVMSEHGTSATWMMRGAGVPEGVIAHELTSIVDLYPTLAHLVGFPVPPGIDGSLPAVFGGSERDAVYSASQFPGQTFKLAVRTHEHVLRVETRGAVEEDGTVDFTDARTAIYPRGHELDAAYATDSAALRAFFYPRARAFLQGIGNNGETFPLPQREG